MSSIRDSSLFVNTPYQTAVNTYPTNYFEPIGAPVPQIIFRWNCGNPSSCQPRVYVNADTDEIAVRLDEIIQKVFEK